MKYRKINSFILKFRICFFVLSLSGIFYSCKSNNNISEAQQAAKTDDEGYDKNLTNSNYDWTGTYELSDNGVLYTLKLHRRSVDASYEMQFYAQDKNIDLYKSSIYDAKDGPNAIHIKYLNNFQMDASSLGFKSGDTLFTLLREADSMVCVFNKWKPTELSNKWKKISDNY